MPDQAAPAGQKPPRANFIRGDVRAMTRAERAAKMGTANAAAANRVEDRYVSAERARRDNAPTPNVRGRLVAENPNFGIGRNEVELVQGATSAAVNPAPQPEQAIRRIDDTIKNELAALNSAGQPQQGPVMNPKGYDRTFGERAATIGNKIKGYATSPRFQRGRRISYGAGGVVAGLAGLDAMIGGERERRQEEMV